MLTISVNIDRDAASPALARLDEAMKPENLMQVFARSVQNAVRDNFDELESSRQNRIGGERTHYYSRAREGTSYTIESDDTAIVHVRQIGMRLHYYGGVVRPGVNSSSTTGQPTKYLTIAASPESYGHRAADFPEMDVLWGSSGPYALARVEQKTLATVTARGAKTANTEILFWLVKEAHFEADKSVLPSGDVLNSSVAKDFGSYVRGVLNPGSIGSAAHAAKEREVYAAFGGGL